MKEAFLNFRNTIEGKKQLWASLNNLLNQGRTEGVTIPFFKFPLMQTKLHSPEFCQEANHKSLLQSQPWTFAWQIQQYKRLEVIDKACRSIIHPPQLQFLLT